MIFPDDIFYVAAPYNDPNPWIASAQMDLFYQLDGIFIAHQMVTVSPLSKHPTLIRSKLPNNWQFWEDYTEKLLFRCTHMLILTMEYWTDQSKEVVKLINHCDQNLIPYTLLNTGDVRSGRFCDMIRTSKVK